MRRWPAINPPLIALVVLLLLGGGALASRNSWLPSLKQAVLQWAGAPAPSAEEGHDEHDHAGHDHGHDSADSIEISPQGLKNIGFEPVAVTLGPYRRTVRWPAMVVERPGRSQVHVAAPMTGIVTKVLVQEGMAVQTGSVLFEMRLTHEELVTAQREFLKTAESLDVVERELKRLKSISEGLVAGKRILDEEYSRQKLEGSLRAERQGLMLHGLSAEQIDGILESRQLLKTLTVRAPQQIHAASNERLESPADEHLFHVQTLMVNPGQQVEAGSPLCVLADHCELFVRGRAFENGAEQLRPALQKQWPITAHLVTGGEASPTIDNLKLVYLADHVDEESRAFNFYLSLPNEVMDNRRAEDGSRYLLWKHRPGQRMELEIPVDLLEKKIVLPVNAIIEEGAESYVFRQNGKKFDRVAVHVELRDRSQVVIANDGALFPGNIVAARGAYQMQLALKNKSGGAVDPHAGHTH